MQNTSNFITEINLIVAVEDTPKRIEIPIPFDYDGQEILQLLANDITLSPAGAEAFADGAGEDGVLELAYPDDIAGEMDPDAFGEWESRAQDLGEIDQHSVTLEETGLLPGQNPSTYETSTGGPTLALLDERIENDLHNAAIVGNETKAAFRAAREASGASQAALADALGVNVRAVKRWEAPGQPEPPLDARHLVESWQADTMAGAQWHMRRAEELRDDCHEAYMLVLYRNQEEFDRALAPLLANAPSYHWQDVLAESRTYAPSEGDDLPPEASRPYTNFPGTRSYWRANAAAKTAAILMDARKIPYGFVYLDEQRDSLYWEGVWVPRADVQRIETAEGAIVVCGMR